MNLFACSFGYVGKWCSALWKNPPWSNFFSQGSATSIYFGLLSTPVWWWFRVLCRWTHNHCYLLTRTPGKTVKKKIQMIVPYLSPTGFQEMYHDFFKGFLILYLLFVLVTLQFIFIKNECQFLGHLFRWVWTACDFRIKKKVSLVMENMPFLHVLWYTMHFCMYLHSD